jgi:hypothetical protein
MVGELIELHAQLTSLVPDLRRVTLANLPAQLELKEIFSIIWGGRIQMVKYTAGESTCVVTFLTDDACKTYCRQAAIGIPWPKDKTRIITIAKVEIRRPNEFEAGLVETKVSRCVRLSKLQVAVTAQALREAAMGKGRTVERMISGKYGSVSTRTTIDPDLTFIAATGYADPVQ